MPSDMPRFATRGLLSLPVIALLATVMHLDWHAARGHHHRLSLAWEQHWLLGAIAFALLAWYVLRRWPERPLAAALLNTVAALAVAMVAIPAGTYLYYDHRLSIASEPEAWLALGEFMAAGACAFITIYCTLQFAARRPRVRRNGHHALPYARHCARGAP